MVLVGIRVFVGVLGWRVIKRESNVGISAAVGAAPVAEGMEVPGWIPGD